MQSDQNGLLVQLQARILAQEMFMRTLLSAAFMNTPDPIASLEEMRSEQVRMAGEAVRPTGTYEDAVWETALKTFHNELDQIAARLKAQINALSAPPQDDEWRTRSSKGIEEPKRRALYNV